MKCFFASHYKKRFTERGLDLVWQRVPDFGAYVDSSGRTLYHMNQPLVK